MLNEQNTTEGSFKFIKCVVWDLDNTLWDGVLLENTHVSLRAHIPEIIKTLDSRGILNSIASRNEHASAMAKLEQFSLHEYFLYPQISWDSKADSLRTIADALNIGIDTIAFVDDEPFEREEVAFTLPAVRCIDAKEIDGLLDLPQMNPYFLTEDSTMRRLMYLSDMERNKTEKEFTGSNEEFLATLQMTFTLSSAMEEDLQRVEELTVRTNQLNTTGYTYSYEELNQLRQSDKHMLLIASLDDKYGTYGKIGLALVECGKDVWTIKLLLMSCRVMSRGVGTIMLNYIMSLAKDSNACLYAEFVPNGRNRMMYITYKFSGFREIEQKDNLVVLENNLSHIQPFPAYVRVHLTDVDISRRK